MRYLTTVVVLLLVVVTESKSQGLNRFLIGADFIHRNTGVSDGNGITNANMINWARLNELHLNAGTAYVSRQAQHNGVVMDVLHDAPDTFNVILERWTSRNLLWDNTNGYYLRRFTGASQRYKYQVESVQDSDPSLRDFDNQSFVGFIQDDYHGENDPSTAEDKWNRRYILGNEHHLNSIYVDPASHSAGYVASNLVRKNEMQYGNYRWKVRMRLPSAQFPFDPDELIARVEVYYRGQSWIEDITGEMVNLFADPNYHEVFSQNDIQILPPSPPYPPDPPQLDELAAQILGRQDYYISQTQDDVEIRLHWYGSYECYFDYIAMDIVHYGGSTDADHLFRGFYNQDIANTVSPYFNEARLWRYKISDEPLFDEWLASGYVDQLIRSLPNSQKRTWSWYNSSYEFAQPYAYPAKQYQVDIGQPQQLTYRYVPNDDCPLYYQPDYLYSIQNNYDGWYLDHLRAHAQLHRESGIPMYHTIKSFTYSENINTSPRPYHYTELRLNVNMGVAYGVKGIIYHLFHSYVEANGQLYEGLVDVNGNPIRTDYYGQDRWGEVIKINQKLEALGTHLMPLTWVGTYGTHRGEIGNEHLLRVVTGDQSLNQRFVEVGFFTDDLQSSGPPNYVYVVNRRTDPTETRNIIVKLGSLYTGHWKIKNVRTEEEWIVNTSAATDMDDGVGGFTDFFLPGDGELYQLTPLPGGEIVLSGCHRDDLVITEGAVVTLGVSTIEFQNGKKLEVNGTLNATGTVFTSCAQSPTYNSWNGIYVTGPLANITLQSCSVYFAGIGVHLTNLAQGTVQNTLMLTCNAGIVAENATQVFAKKDTLAEMYYSGIVGSLTSYMWLEWNSINGNSQNYFSTASGIQLSTVPISYVHRNTIQGFYGSGLTTYDSYVFGGIPPRTPDSLRYGRNSFYNDRMAITATGGSIYFGDQGVFGGEHNNFLTPLYQGYVDGYSSMQGKAHVWVRLNHYYSYNPPAGFNDHGGLAEIYHNPPDLSGPFPKVNYSSDPFDEILEALEKNSAHEAKKAAKKFMHGKSWDQISPLQIRTMQLLSKKHSLDSLRDEIHSFVKKDSTAEIKQLRSEMLASGLYYSRAREVQQDNLFSTNPDLRQRARLLDALYSIKTDYDTAYARATVDQELSLDPTNNEVQFYKMLVEHYVDLREGRCNREFNDELPKTTQSTQAEGFEIPTEIYPNPFHSTSTISISLPESLPVSVVIYDMLGRKIRTLLNRSLSEGKHTVQFESLNLSPGTYLCRIVAGEFSSAKQIVIVR